MKRQNLSRPLCILHVNTADLAGGAAKMALSLLNAQRKRGHSVWLAVGSKRSDHPNVLLIPNTTSTSRWERFWRSVQVNLANYGQRVRGIGLWKLSRAAGALANPWKWLDIHSGIEDFHFVGSRHLMSLPPQKPDIIHLHNLHGDYFDLRVLPTLSRQVPVVLTLHDEWLLTGHCSYSLQCERWQTGCGKCPDLNRYPPVQRDSTAYNWRRKRIIYQQSHLYVTTPSQWLMSRAQLRMFNGCRCRVIPNGIDLEVFRPADKRAARAALGLPYEKTIVLFVGAMARLSPFKDYPTFEAALRLLTPDAASNLFALIVGDDASDRMEQIGAVPTRRIPYQVEPQRIATFYRAADLFIHAARAEVWGLTATESMACGTPVIASAVGGLPEQMRGLQGAVPDVPHDLNSNHADEATGLLVPPSDPAILAIAITTMARHPDLLRKLGENAARLAASRFGIERCSDEYLDFYEEALAEVTLR